MSNYSSKFTEDPRFILAEQRWNDARAAAEEVGSTLRVLDRTTSARYAEWQQVIAKIRGEKRDGAIPVELDKLKGWGYTCGTYSYGELRDRLSAAGAKGEWDLSTSREGLEKLIHQHIHAVSSVHTTYSCPACKVEREKP